jgi:hypothetical protein
MTGAIGDTRPSHFITSLPPGRPSSAAVLSGFSIDPLNGSQ